jgi:hypothetical protein
MMFDKILTNTELTNLKMTALINAYSAVRIPLMAFITPRVIELTDTRSVIRVALNRRTKNHLRVMYFGALSMGAELSIALKAVQAIHQSGKRIDFLFKDFKCEFLKRADDHVHFICDEADKVAAMIHEATSTPDRLTRTFKGHAVLAGQPDEPVMKYELSLSVRNRGFGKSTR